MQQEYELPRTLLERAGEDRWLAGDRAVYLNFLATPADDPSAQGTPLRLLYDFQRGQLYINSAQHAPDSHNGDATENWLSEEEFQSAVTQIEP